MTTSINNQSKPMHEHEVILPIVVNGKSFHCDSNRMWNLTEMHKELGLPDAKRPYNWRTVVSTHLERAANLRVVHGDNGGTWGTEEATIAYAMWVSVDFYMTVIRAFIAVRNDNISKAKQLAGQNAELKPISDVWLKTLESRGQSLTQCLKVLCFKNPQKVIKELKKFVSVRNPFYGKHPVYGIQLNAKGRQSGYWKHPEGDGRFNNDGLKICLKGFEWLKENKDELELMTRRRLSDGTQRALSKWERAELAGADKQDDTSKGQQTL